MELLRTSLVLVLVLMPHEEDVEVRGTIDDHLRYNQEQT